MVHTGLGWAEGGVSWRGGYRYNFADRDGSVFTSTDANVHFGGPFEAYYLVHESRSDASSNVHFCYGILPPLINDEGIHQNWLHDFDVEVGGVFLVGLSFGFSPGEFLDFLLGWFFLDLAGDDDPKARKQRDYFESRAGRPGPVIPKKSGS
jgi:hypothetical protein